MKIRAIILSTFVGLSIILIFSALSAISLLPQVEITPLAGVSVFAQEDYDSWLKCQLDPSIPDEKKIASTINSYFNIKYKSWVRLELLEFNFLFDMNDASAREDYAYERGLYHLMLTSWKHYNNALESYKYEPKFYELSVDNNMAHVKVAPEARVKHRDPKIIDSGTPWSAHVFSLVKNNNLWFIRSVTCDDSTHNLHPHGSDFNRIARELIKRATQEEKKQILRMAKMKEDPRLKPRVLPKSDLTQSHVSTKGWHNYVWGDAVEYATTYTSSSEGTGSYNPLFICFPTADCANFVSQCVWYACGGINESEPIENHDLPMIDDSVPGKTWWADSTGFGIWNGVKACWTAVYDFLYMIVKNHDNNGIGPQGYRGFLVYSWVGDIISQRMKPHLMIITTIIDYNGNGLTNWDEVYISAHTTNRLNKRLSELFPSISYVDTYLMTGFITP